MKRFLSVIFVLSISINLIFSQYGRYKESKYLIGFNLQYPTGMATSTALTSSDQSIRSSFGFGLIIQRKLTQNINIFFDVNAYNYNIFIANRGTDVQSIGNVTENAPQVQYANDLPTDVYFDMQATGIRLGARYNFGKKKFQPWAGAAFGLYDWEVNYCSKNMYKTYGGDRGYVPGLTFLAGVDYRLASRMIITAFADLTSPVAEYSIEGLFNPQLNINDYKSHIMGPYRFGIALSFVPKSSKERK